MEDGVQAPAGWESEFVSKMNDRSSAEEPSPVNRKDKKLRRSPNILESESKKMRHASSPEPQQVHSNGEAGGKRKDEAQRAQKFSDSETERNSSRRTRSPDPRRRNRSRSRSPHRRNSRSPRRRSRSNSPAREHKRGDPRANAARSRQICIDYSRGKCNKGSSCKYIHEDPEEGLSWSRERDEPHNENMNQKHRAARNSNPKDPRDPSRDPRDPRSSKDPKDGRDPRGRKKEENNPLEEQQKMIEQNHQLQAPQLQAPQVQVPQGDWTSLQPVNQWHLNSFASSSIAASLQALQEQNFKIPPPPPPPGFGDLESLVAASTLGAPDLSGAHAAGDSAAVQQSNKVSSEEPENKKASDEPEPGVSEEKQNGEADAEEAEVGTGKKIKKDLKAAMLVRLAVTDYVKEVLKPTWKEGNMSKDVYKTIAKKAVDKVVGTLQSHQIPRTADKVDHFMDFSRQKISKLVQGYVEKYTSK